MPPAAPPGPRESRPGVIDLSRDIGGVLSIGKLAGGPDAGRYYEESVAQGREDYYAGEGERPGTWCGGAAANLGLAGTVDDGQVGRLLAGALRGCHDAAVTDAVA